MTAKTNTFETHKCGLGLKNPSIVKGKSSRGQKGGFTDFLPAVKNSSASYRRISVYTFCLINICLSLSDDANKIKALNIERAQQFKFSLKI